MLKLIIYPLEKLFYVVLGEDVIVVILWLNRVHSLSLLVYYSLIPWMLARFKSLLELLSRNDKEMQKIPFVYKLLLHASLPLYERLLYCIYGIPNRSLDLWYTHIGLVSQYFNVLSIAMQFSLYGICKRKGRIANSCGLFNARQEFSIIQ